MRRGAPLDWAKVTDPCEPETNNWAEKALPGVDVAPVGAIWMILLVEIVNWKLHVPVSPELSATVPVAL